MDRKQIATVLTVVIVVMAGVLCYGLLRDNGSDDVERVGIIGAMKSEVEPLVDAMDDRRSETVAGMEFNIGVLKGHDVVVVQCGMGKVNAGVCAQVLIDRFDVKAVINAGVAGTLDPTLEVGDYVISTEAVQHDFDASPIDYRRGEIPYTGHVVFEDDKGLVEKAYDAVKECAPDAKVVKGRVCSGDQFIVTQEQKDTIISNFGGECCEMEGGAVAQACYLNEVPFVVIRGMSDGGSGKQFEEYQEIMAKQVANAILVMLEKL
ncbi:MAG: 5'-methylthioadenosine/adenosylhomocysteine nucleosidase [archaeon]|nr:5'-methylthioadenosine/adenosylhomocysteine nucleosidase [archaeon]